MLIPFPAQHQSPIQTYKVRSTKLTAEGFFPGDEVTVSAQSVIAAGDWILIRTQDDRIVLRRYDAFSKSLNILGRVEVLIRHFT